MRDLGGAFRWLNFLVAGALLFLPVVVCILVVRSQRERNER